MPCADPFDDPDWLFSIDWDGTRSLLFLDPGRAGSPPGRDPIDLARRFPDVSETVAAPDAAPAVLDGVIAVLDAQGRPDLAALGRRLAAGPALAADLPAVFLRSTSSTWTGGRPPGWTLDRRLEALTRVRRRQ